MSVQAPFLVACSRGDLDVCKLLFVQNPECLWEKHCFDFDCGAIHYAVSSGNLELVKWLISQGGVRMAESRNRLGWTMLHSSLFKGHDEIAQWILAERSGSGSCTTPVDPLPIPRRRRQSAVPYHYRDESWEDSWEEWEESDEAHEIRAGPGFVFDVDAFIMAARSKMWWILPRIWSSIRRWAMRDVDSLSRVMWSCRDCLDAVFSVFSLESTTTWSYAKALQALHETHKDRVDARHIFAQLSRHGLIPRFESTPHSSTNTIFWLCSELGVLDLLVSYWFGDLVTVKRDPMPSESTAAAWIARLRANQGAHRAHAALPESLRLYLSLLSNVLFGKWSEQTELATVLLSAQFHTAPPASLECILERLVFLAEHSLTMSFAGLGMFVELKSLGICHPSMPYPTCPISTCHENCHSAGLLHQLSLLSGAAAQCPWPVFRIIIANCTSSQSAYLSTGALWTMRIRHRASIEQLLMHIHRGLIQRNHPRGSNRLDHCEALWLLSCMDRRNGFMFPNVPLRPHFHIYSMIFCVPGYFE